MITSVQMFADANKSAMVFLKHVTTEEIVDNIRSTDIVDKRAFLLRESFLETHFNLGDNFSDANDLRSCIKILWGFIQL